MDVACISSMTIESARVDNGQNIRNTEKSTKYNRNPSVEELNAIRKVDVYNNYNDWSIVINRGESPLGNSLGDRFFYDSDEYMKNYFDGKISVKDVCDYFDKCCDLMTEYQSYVEIPSTITDERKAEIVGYVYSLLAYKSTMDGANVCYQKGEELNQNYSNNIKDFAYYDSEIYYKWKDFNQELIKRAESKTFELSGKEFKQEDYINKYPNNGFNLEWSLIFLTTNRVASMVDVHDEPPRNFKLFYKENAYISERNEVTSEYIFWSEEKCQRDKSTIDSNQDDKKIRRSDFWNNILLFETWYGLKNMDYLKYKLLSCKQKDLKYHYRQ